ncbi:hypothetical protein [Cardiobacterium valvarum]|uniref:Uncharacterized protein n=1 Tax=Cardiobacterium valvarum F0432 TaxID=797473 RepID=G9ZIW9_9GAMM|nr:hypothetical protein [Cardiobacterium valvarum]EHM50790.1 hypothetical protein HMPREF9080_02736 [Cardiobacterium valvarum F0432]
MNTSIFHQFTHGATDSNLSPDNETVRVERFERRARMRSLYRDAWLASSELDSIRQLVLDGEVDWARQRLFDYYRVVRSKRRNSRIIFTLLLTLSTVATAVFIRAMDTGPETVTELYNSLFTATLLLTAFYRMHMTGNALVTHASPRGEHQDLWGKVYELGTVLDMPGVVQALLPRVVLESYRHITQVTAWRQPLVPRHGEALKIAEHWREDDTLNQGR